MVETDSSRDLAAFDDIARRCAALRERLSKVVVGQEPVIDLLLTALLCRGHVMLVGVPGLAKTLLVRTLARGLALAFKRIQFTPDMVPADILGTELLQEEPTTGARELRFVPGPVFAQLILADEINRTPPRTQAALLEAMAEGQVTVTGRTRRLEQPFMVVATRNPIEQEGTYPLPEAQLDRFMFSINLDYPHEAAERRIVAGEHGGVGDEDEGPAVYDAATLMHHAALIGRMPVSEQVVERAMRLVRATRPGEATAPEEVRRYVEWGAGPRAGRFLVQAACAAAAMAGEPTPLPHHLDCVAPAILRHRVLMNFDAMGEGVTSTAIITRLLETL